MIPGSAGSKLIASAGRLSVTRLIQSRCMGKNWCTEVEDAGGNKYEYHLANVGGEQVLYGLYYVLVNTPTLPAARTMVAKLSSVSTTSAAL